MTDHKDHCDRLDAAIRDVVDYRNKAHPDQKPAMYLTGMDMHYHDTGAAPPVRIRYFVDVPTGTTAFTALDESEIDWEEKK